MRPGAKEVEIYVARFAYGTAHLYKAKAKETDKMYRIVRGQVQVIFGTNDYGVNIRKDDRNPVAFANLSDAIAWLLNKAEQYLESVSKSVITAQAQVNDLTEKLKDTPPC